MGDTSTKPGIGLDVQGGSLVRRTECPLVIEGPAAEEVGGGILVCGRLAGLLTS